MDVTGIVLAGGRAARFGADKLAAPLGGRTVLDRAIGAVARIAPAIVVVGSARTLLPIEGVAIRAVADPEPFGGPLQALAGALGEVATGTAIVVAGDMPTLVPGVLDLLIDTLESGPDLDAVVLGDPRDPSRRQPLPVALRVDNARRAAASAVDAGERSLVRLLARLTLAEVPVERWLALDPEATTLADVDIPDDLDRLRGGAPDQRMR